MGCCLGVILLAGAPRLALFVWWLLEPTRVTGAFGEIVVSGWSVPMWVLPVLGFLMMPWLTIAYVWVSPGGIAGLEWVVLAIALLIDLGAHGGGGREYNRRRASA